jgi:hypothetical protein
MVTNLGLPGTQLDDKRSQGDIGTLSGLARNGTFSIAPNVPNDVFYMELPTHLLGTYATAGASPFR